MERDRENMLLPARGEEILPCGIRNYRNHHVRAVSVWSPKHGSALRETRVCAASVEALKSCCESVKMLRKKGRSAARNFVAQLEVVRAKMPYVRELCTCVKVHRLAREGRVMPHSWIE